MRVHVGRQALVDRTGETIGYELLFRAAAASTTADIRDADQATASVMIRTFLDLGLEELVGNRLAFVNLPRAFLVGDMPLPFRPDQVVLEILEDVPADPEVVRGVRALVDAGYRIAMDDVIADEARWELLELAHYIKIDVLSVAPAELPALVERCRAPGRILLAEKVETPEQFDMCVELGMDLFQGYLFARAETMSGRSLDANELTCLNLITLLSSPDTPLTEIIAVVERDPGLCYRVLRAANSAEAGLRFKVSSIKQAIVVIGRRTLQGWVTLMALSASLDAEPLSQALARARMCELLAEQSVSDAHAAFLVGLVSAVSDLLAVPLAELTDQLSLDDAVRAALLEDAGPLSDVLRAALNYEAGELPDFDSPFRFDDEDLRSCYLDSLRFSQAALTGVAAS